MRDHVDGKGCRGSSPRYLGLDCEPDVRSAFNVYEISGLDIFGFRVNLLGMFENDDGPAVRPSLCTVIAAGDLPGGDAHAGGLS